MGSFRLYATALWTLEKHLAFLETEMLDHFFGGVSFCNGTLTPKLQSVKYRVDYDDWLTGSENIVRMCEANAKKDSILKMIIFMVLYTG